jgi:hypothetical protein
MPAILLLGAGQAVGWAGRPAAILAAGIGLLWCAELGYLAMDVRALPRGCAPLLRGRLRAALVASYVAVVVDAAVITGSWAGQPHSRIAALAAVIAATATMALIASTARR